MPDIRDIEININQIGIPDIPEWLTSKPTPGNTSLPTSYTTNWCTYY